MKGHDGEVIHEGDIFGGSAAQVRVLRFDFATNDRPRVRVELNRCGSPVNMLFLSTRMYTTRILLSLLAVAAFTLPLSSEALN